MRTRLIRPEHFADERLVDLAPLTRLLYAGLPCCADRQGILEDRPRRIKLQIFPGDDYDVDAGLNALQAAGLVARYTDPEGRALLFLTEFEKDQNPHRNEKQSEFPWPILPVDDQEQTHGQPKADTCQAEGVRARALTLSDPLPLSDTLPLTNTLGDTLTEESQEFADPPNRTDPEEPSNESCGCPTADGIQTDFTVSARNRAKMDALKAKHAGERPASEPAHGQPETSTPRPVQKESSSSRSKHPGVNQDTAGASPPQ